MDKFKISFKYTANGVNYSSNFFETDHYSMSTVANNDHIRIVLNTKGAPLCNLKFKMTVPFSYDCNDRIFLNGYQSWTDCRELFIDEIGVNMHTARLIPLLFSPMGASGDYTFKKYDQRKGVFHGYSYAYIRNGETVNLFGSLSERSGYTIINTVCPESKIVFEKELEGVTIDGEYVLMDIIHFTGTMDEVFDKYFEVMKIEKPRAKRANGYTTWYNYYSNVNENIVINDLEALSKVDAKIDFFQIDDGFQTAVGDWLSIDGKKFPHGMKYIADRIHEKGMKAGLWLAPLGAQYQSKVAKEHPEWLIKDKFGKPVKCGMNWGGFYGIDINNPEAREYVRHFFDVVLNEWGYDMVKLDFLYAASIVPGYNKSRGQLMCEAMDFIRECVGDKLILGCGVPLAPAFGKVDYCRIGADMGLNWNKNFGIHREDVSTRAALGNSIFRRGLDGRAFLNDPDVFLLRDNNMKMTLPQRKIIANINRIFGSLLFISDNVDEYDDEKMQTLLKMFNSKKPELITAEFVTNDLVEIQYIDEDGKQRLSFNIKTGEIY